MRMRCGMLTALVALAACGSSAGMPRHAAGAGGSGPPGSAAAGRCGPRSARTLAADSRARVYSTGNAVYGCAAGAHQSFRLGAAARSLREGRVGPVALAGVDAAYGLATFGVDTGSAQVIVRRLSDGRQLRSAPATQGRLGPESVQAVDALVVKANGAVAWIAEARSIISQRSAVIQVARDDARGNSVLDSGTGIDARSLRLHGSSLSWRDGSQTRSATLR
jgi:hypothetical protein